MLYTFYLFILGLLFGSFYYCMGVRLSNNESLIHPSSHCDFCNHRLGILDLIPIFSFVFLKGKCRYCQKKLPLDSLLFELLTGLLFSFSYVKFHFSYEFFILLSSLVVLIFITDFKYMIILDSPLIVSVVITFILKCFYFNFNVALISLGHGLGMFLTMLAIGKFGTLVFKKESLGGGDIKFSFVMGMVLTYKFSMVALILSTFLALPYAIASMYLSKAHEVPYGPFLVSSVFLVFYFFDKFQYIFYFI